MIAQTRYAVSGLSLEVASMVNRTNYGYVFVRCLRLQLAAEVVDEQARQQDLDGGL